MFFFKTFLARPKLYCSKVLSRPTGTWRYRGEKGTTYTIDKASTYIFFLFFFYLFINDRPGTHTAARQVAQRRMKARHQFKKSTPSVVAGKNAAPVGGGWSHRNPCQSDRHRPDLSLVE